MRESMTLAEAKLFAALSDQSYKLPKFHAQHVVYPFIVDFVCLEKYLIVEVDGKTHEKTNDSDAIRDNELARMGFKVLRFTNGEVIASIEEVLRQIEFECNFRKSISQSVTFTKSKKYTKRKMVLTLPRVVYEEPVRTRTRTRASKVRRRKALDSSNGEIAEVFCAICKQPIARADVRVRYRKGESEQLFWAHKSCRE